MNDHDVLRRAALAVVRAADHEGTFYEAQSLVEDWALDALSAAVTGDLDDAELLLNRYEHALVAVAERMVVRQCVMLPVGERQVRVRASILLGWHDAVDANATCLAIGGPANAAGADPERPEATRRFADRAFHRDRIGAIRCPFAGCRPSVRIVAIVLIRDSGLVVQQLGIVVKFVGMFRVAVRTDEAGCFTGQVEPVALGDVGAHLRWCSSTPAWNRQRALFLLEERQLRAPAGEWWSIVHAAKETRTARWSPVRAVSLPAPTGFLAFEPANALGCELVAPLTAVVGARDLGVAEVTELEHLAIHPLQLVEKRSAFRAKACLEVSVSAVWDEADDRFGHRSSSSSSARRA